MQSNIFISIFMDKNENIQHSEPPCPPTCCDVADVVRAMLSDPDKALLFTEGCVEQFDRDQLQSFRNAERYGEAIIARDRRLITLPPPRKLPEASAEAKLPGGLPSPWTAFRFIRRIFLRWGMECLQGRRRSEYLPNQMLSQGIFSYDIRFDTLTLIHQTSHDLDSLLIKKVGVVHTENYFETFCKVSEKSFRKSFAVPADFYRTHVSNLFVCCTWWNTSFKKPPLSIFEY